VVVVEVDVVVGIGVVDVVVSGVVVDVVVIVVASHKPHNPGQKEVICGMEHCETGMLVSQVVGSLSQFKISQTKKKIKFNLILIVILKRSLVRTIKIKFFCF
jgi:hypothetical protein